MSPGRAGHGRWLTGAGALCIAFAPVIFTLSAAPPSLAALVRFAWALPMVALVCALRPDSRAAFHRPGWTGFALAGGAFFAADILLWHRVIELLGAGPATLLVNTQVVWVTLIGVVWLREWPARPFWWALLPLALGMALLSGASPRGFAIPGGGPGLAMGIGSGAAYGAALLCLREASRRAAVPAESVLLVQLAGALGVAAFAVALEPRTPALEPAQHAWLIALAAGPQVLGWFLINSGMRSIPAHEGALMLVLQPAASVALAWWILDQQLPAPRIAGALLLLGSVGVALRATSR